MEHVAERPVPAIDLGGTQAPATSIFSERTAVLAAAPTPEAAGTIAQRNPVAAHSRIHDLDSAN